MNFGVERWNWEALHSRKVEDRFEDSLEQEPKL
jgi:hypothetical protein